MLKRTSFLLLTVVPFAMTDFAFAGKRCYDNGDCRAAQYCKKADGDCDGKGTCTQMPDACPDVYDPVCGCDEVTYSNACYAALNGVSVDYHDVCEEPGVCTHNGQCGFGEYCRKDVGDCDGVGVCVLRPEACLDVWDPVCGCDGNTYSNGCYAAQAGVSVDYEDACADVRSQVCYTNADCGFGKLFFGQYCRKEVGDCDGEGICVARPKYCLDVWIPVCGCDGRTYSNHCYAARAGVNVDYVGDCASVRGGTCQTNADCGYREYCRKAVGDCDGEGVCTLRPRWCLAVWIPVCGCDGRIYSNDCYAARNGVNVEYMGYCPY